MRVLQEMTVIKHAPLLAVALFLTLSACGDKTSAPTSTASTAPDQVRELNLYSSRHYDTDIALYEDFEERTGISVNLIEAEADALIERIRSEGEFSPADLLITVDAGRLWKAEQEGLFQPVSSTILDERIPGYLRHPDGLWFGLSKRARVIIYNQQAGRPEGLENYSDLADPRFDGQVCIRSSGNIYNISLLAGIIAHDGLAAAEDWAQGVVENFARPPQGNDTGHIRAVASGECRIAVVNTYYLGRIAASEAEEDQALIEAIGIIFPNQETTGTHVNISGAGLLRHAPNRENAIAFLEYLTEDSAQSYFANGNHEYPVVASVQAAAAVLALGDFREDELNAAELGVHQQEAVRVFDRVGWK